MQHMNIFDQFCIFFPLKGLNTLQNLKELNLADNQIEKIGRICRIL